ncbi:MAG: hypothetical protein HY259_09750, partial [Chloroflexi bacterium]|nr:hypothetical protein [Chloroflexota bacterium]
MSFAPFTFVQVSDSHARANGAEWRARVTQILAAIAQLRPSPAFVLHTGDLMDEPSAEAAQAHRALFA